MSHDFRQAIQEEDGLKQNNSNEHKRENMSFPHCQDLQQFALRGTLFRPSMCCSRVMGLWPTPGASLWMANVWSEAPWQPVSDGFGDHVSPDAA